jgi:PQQ-like domain
MILSAMQISRPRPSSLRISPKFGPERAIAGGMIPANCKKILAVSIFVSGFAFARSAQAQTPAPFTLAPQGCSMAHCTMNLSGSTNVVPPVSSDTSVVVKKLTPGALFGLGCSSNYTIVACTYQSITPSLIVFDGDGNRIFDSGRIFDSTAWTSVPIVSSEGEVIACDDRSLVRFAANGSVVWQTPIVGTGEPISPVLTKNGVVLLATSGGEITSYSVQTGAILATFPVKLDGFIYGTQNTPSVNGNRVYVSMAAQNQTRHGRLVAIDVDPTNTSAPLTIAWSYVFGGPSGASPLFVNGVVYFDGSSINPGPYGSPTLFAVQDMGTTPQLLWEDPVGPGIFNPIPLVVTTPLPDPRGGIWFYVGNQSVLQRVDASSGIVTETINMDSFFANPVQYRPSSALTMSLANPMTGDPVMMLGIEPGNAAIGPALSVALDLGPTPSLLWKAQITQAVSKENAVFSQWPIVANSQGLPRVVSPGGPADTYFVGVPGGASGN